MNLWHGFRFIRDRFIAHKTEELAELRRSHRWHQTVVQRHNELQRERRELRRRLRSGHGGHGGREKWAMDREEMAELRQRLRIIEKELNELHFQTHLTGGGIRDADFRRYYRHISRSRIGIIAFNLVLWFFLFRFGGIGTGLETIVLVVLLATTVGGFFEMGLLIRIRERILKPIDNLQQGVEEIARGNYNVVVEKGATNEVAPLIEAFNGMARKLGEGERLKAEYEENRKSLIANISHDLKTPITSVQGYVEAIMAQEQIPPEKMRNYLKIIYSNTDYMNRLIDDLFLFSKLDMQKLELTFTPIRIKPFMADLMEEFSLDLAERGVSFVYLDELEDEWQAALDGKRIHQVIRNLIDNAVKYGPVSGLEIRARLFARDDRVGIELKDNGPGIPEDGLTHIFERFYRVDSERTKDFSSTGLGLAIAHELVKAHGGEINVMSSLGTGTVFTVILPGAKEASPVGNSK